MNQQYPPDVKALKGTYPEAPVFRAAIQAANETHRRQIARTWLCEGIPYAFADAPLEYQFIRASLATRLAVDSQSIGLTGSARLGYSLAREKYGTKFHAKSDLDLYVVDQRLFEELRSDARRWMSDYSDGTVAPTTGEKRYWDANKDTVPQQLDKGVCAARGPVLSR